MKRKSSEPKSFGPSTSPPKTSKKASKRPAKKVLLLNGKPLPTEPITWEQYTETYLSPEERQRLAADTAVDTALINLAALRRACQLTQTQLAQRLQTSQTNVARLEAAKGATFKSVVKVAQALGLQVSISLNGKRLWPVHKVVPVDLWGPL